MRETEGAGRRKLKIVPDRENPGNEMGYWCFRVSGLEIGIPNREERIWRRIRGFFFFPKDRTAYAQNG